MSSHNGEVFAVRLSPGHDVRPAGVQTLAQPVGASPLGPVDGLGVVDAEADAPPATYVVLLTVFSRLTSGPEERTPRRSDPPSSAFPPEDVGFD